MSTGGVMFINLLLTLLLLVFNLLARFMLLFRLGHLQKVNFDSLTPRLCFLILFSLKNVLFASFIQKLDLKQKISNMK